jgi:hypothetical protein
MRRPAGLYVTAISLTVAMAVGTHAASENGLIPLGAFLRAWGLPVYFAAQMILALSVLRS